MSEQAAETTVTQATEAQEPQESQTEQDQNAGSSNGDEQNSPEESEQSWDPDRARAKIKKVNAENKALRERASKAEEAAETVPDLEQQNTTLGSENLRLRVGYELGLPLNLAVRLQGSTREELVADAESLMEIVSPAKTGPQQQRPTTALKPGATAERIDPPQPDDAYPADFLPRRMRERAGNST